MKKILEIKNEDTEFLSNFFNSINFEDVEFPYYVKKENVGNSCVYMREIIEGEKLIEIKCTTIGYLFKNNEVNEKFINIIDEIKRKFNPKIIWLMFYPPKSSIVFHQDKNKNRHILTLNYNERFFSYECGFSVLIEKINNILIEFKNDINKFNDFFLNYHETCEILNLDSYSIYTFENSNHSFINDSDKIRVNLVFEV